MFVVENIEVDVAKRAHITNSYIGYDTDTKEGILIDPGYDGLKIISKIVELDVKIKYILITHGHADHIGALKELQKFTNAKIFISDEDYDVLCGKKEGYFETLGVEKFNIKNAEKLRNGDNIKFGNYSLEIISTPGHTSGSLCFYEASTNLVFTGDTLFSNCYGRCDLESGSFYDMKNSLNKLFNRFSGDTKIYPGHGKISTLNEAKKYVRILVARKGEDYESF